jgi:hypothetical protein
VPDVNAEDERQQRLAVFARFMNEAAPIYDIAFADRTDEQWATLLDWLPYLEGSGGPPPAKEAT